MHWNLLHISFTDINKNCSMVFFMVWMQLNCMFMIFPAYRLQSIKLICWCLPSSPCFSPLQIKLTKCSVSWIVAIHFITLHSHFINHQNTHICTWHLFILNIMLCRNVEQYLYSLRKRRSAPILLLIIYFFLKMLHQIRYPLRKKLFRRAFFGSVWLLFLLYFIFFSVCNFFFLIHDRISIRLFTIAWR